jgi:O-antigen/teichoic acid export membrane protein
VAGFDSGSRRHLSGDSNVAATSRGFKDGLPERARDSLRIAPARSLTILMAPRSNFSRQVIAITGGSVIGQLVLLGVTPLLTRLYGPVEFGLFGLFTVFVNTASVALALRFDMAIPAARSTLLAERLLALNFAVLLPTSLLATLIFLGLQQIGPRGFRALPTWSAALVLVALALTGLFTTLRLWQARALKFRNIGSALASQGVARALLPMIFGVLNPMWFGLAVGDVMGRVFGILRLLPGTRGALVRLLREHPLHLLVTARRFRRYPMLLLPSSLIDASASFLPLPLIASLFGIGAAGEFALITRIAAAPSALLGAAVADVFHAHFPGWLHESEQVARTEFIRTLIKLASISAALYIPSAILAPLAMPKLLGQEWAQAGHAFRILTPYLAVALVVNPLSRVLAVTGRMGYKLIIDFFFLLLPTAGLWATRALGFGPALAVFSTLSTAIFTLYLYLMWRSIGHPVQST